VAIPSEVTDQFNAGTRTESVSFIMNDAVRVTGGKNKGRVGAVVSLFSLDPITTYLVEPSSEPWGDFQASQSDLELVE
jgi:hypothetical protein